MLAFQSRSDRDPSRQVSAFSASARGSTSAKPTDRARRGSSGLWFGGWKGRGPPPGRYADADRPPEVAAPRTWLLSEGWRRVGLVDPAEVPGR